MIYGVSMGRPSTPAIPFMIKISWIEAEKKIANGIRQHRILSFHSKAERDEMFMRFIRLLSPRGAANDQDQFYVLMMEATL